MRGAWAKREFLKRLHGAVYCGGDAPRQLTAAEKLALEQHCLRGVLSPSCDGEVLRESAWTLHEARCVDNDVYGRILLRLTEALRDQRIGTPPAPPIHHPDIERILYVCATHRAGNRAIYHTLLSECLARPPELDNGSCSAVLLEAFSRLSHLSHHANSLCVVNTALDRELTRVARAGPGHATPTPTSHPPPQRTQHALREDRSFIPALVARCLACHRLRRDGTQQGASYIPRVMLALCATEATLRHSRTADPRLSLGIGWARLGGVIESSLCQRRMSIAALSPESLAGACYAVAVLPPHGAEHAETRHTLLTPLIHRARNALPDLGDPGGIQLALAVALRRDAPGLSPPEVEAREAYTRLASAVSSLWLGPSQASLRKADPALLAARWEGVAAGVLCACAALSQPLPPRAPAAALLAAMRRRAWGGDFATLLGLAVYLMQEERRGGRGGGGGAAASSSPPPPTADAVLQRLGEIPEEESSAMFASTLSPAEGHPSASELRRAELVGCLVPALVLECGVSGRHAEGAAVLRAAGLHTPGGVAGLRNAELGRLALAAGRLGPGGAPEDTLRHILRLAPARLSEGHGGWVTATDIARLWHAARALGAAGGAHPLSLSVLDSCAARHCGAQAFGGSPKTLAAMLKSAASLRAPHAGLLSIALHPLRGNDPSGAGAATASPSAAFFKGAVSSDLASILCSLVVFGYASEAAEALRCPTYLGGVQLGSASDVEAVLRAASHAGGSAEARLEVFQGVAARGGLRVWKDAPLELIQSVVVVHCRVGVGVEVSPILAEACGALVGMRGIGAAEAGRLEANLCRLGMAGSPAVQYLGLVAKRQRQDPARKARGVERGRQQRDDKGPNLRVRRRGDAVRS